MKASSSKFLPPEWYPQSGIMLTWPHGKSDWFDLLNEVEDCFTLIAREILKEKKLKIEVLKKRKTENNKDKK